MARRKQVVKHVVENGMADHMKWSVMWLVVKDGDYSIIDKDMDNDLSEAIRLYTKAKAAGKKFATLRCRNVGFAPAERFRPYVARVRDKRWIRGKRQKGVTKYKFVTKVPMLKLNRKGIFWCPYCREMRKFQDQSAFFFEGIIVDAPGIYCPICGVSHRDWHVRKWNPIAKRMWVDETNTRRKIGKR
jgi:hypothetical protein